MRIACTALGKRIKAGRPNKSGDAFVGNPQDVTSDCLKAIIEFVGVGNCVTVKVDGKNAFEIAVTAASPTTPATPIGD